ncbi:hypothetical protein OV203_49335 [Nannocystis sp. ILAH1]|uniref:hypothetical protein n=1 Tax=Nannocystis sp. ILAH1 TaxID=2996789 RepID=UPI00226F9278|nr:hypothetical protein [Nannocystis sp. ILAH1]MCY0995228.1 hypothetical protein [Nannocystis sp. ILAH1]
MSGRTAVVEAVDVVTSEVPGASVVAVELVGTTPVLAVVVVVVVVVDVDPPVAPSVSTES